MRRTDISRFGDNINHTSLNKKSGKNKGIRIFLSSFRILWRLLISIFAITFLTSGIVLISLNSYKSTILENDIALNITASKMSLTSFVYVNNEKGEPEEYDRVYNTENRVWIDFKDIPQNMKNAIIAIEDKRFYEHKGIDWFRTTGAALNLAGGSANYGGSTLTQQLVKNITEDNQPSLTRKMREIFRASELEKRYSKDEILESYLNVVNFGGGNRGVQAAANSYFNKNIQDCSLAQCAAIAGITQNPTAYNPILHPEKNKSRREIVLKEMLEQEKISQTEYNSAKQESDNMNFEESNNNSSQGNGSQNTRNWYMEVLLKDVVNDLCEKYNVGKSTAEDMIYKQGLKIYSAMDVKAQKIAEDSLQNKNVMPSDKNLELGYIMMDLDGRILATIGSRKEKLGNLLYDRACTARRQPGSTIKPIAAYAPAIDCGMYTYSSLIPDEPLQVPTTHGTKSWPVNWYKSYKGKVTLQWAIEKSANAPVAQVVKALTPAKSYEFLTKKLKINSLDSNDATSLAALATGGTRYGVTPREMTNAFQIFGNGGKFKKSYSYFYVTDRNDKVILDNRETTAEQVISPTSANIMNRLLRNVVIGPEGTGRSANIPGWEIVGKTGTTTDNYDSWFVGMSPYAVAGIWTGYDNPKTIRDTSLAIKIWKHIMAKYLEGKQNINYTFDKNTVTATYCKQSGNLATSSCPSTATGYYANGALPPSCSGHSESAQNAEENNNEKEKEQQQQQSKPEKEEKKPAESNENNKPKNEE